MEYIPIIVGVVALLVAAFTFFKAGGLVIRIQALEKKNRELEAGLRSLERDNKRSGQNQGRESNRPAKGSQQASQPQQPRNPQQPQQEPRQKQQGQPQGKGQQQEPRVKQGQPQPLQERPPQEARQKPEGQPAQQKQPREPRQPQEPRQKQGQPQPQAGPGNQPGQPREPRQPQQRRNENRRREPMNPLDPGQTPLTPPAANSGLGTGLVGDDLLTELTQPQAPTPARQPEPPVSRTRYAIIPEDGVIKSHQLQQRPDSDSYLEIDAPEDGSVTTNYRFNLSGNQAFVISQGMDRLENAFSFEKPSNRMVSRIVQQGDGVLTRTSAGWKIQEKAKIDFR